MKKKSLILGLALVTAIGCGGGANDDDLPPPSATTQAQGTPTSAPPTGSATVKGVVRFEGTAPAPKKLQISADPNCAGQHAQGLMSEEVVVGANGALANVVVRVTGVSGTFPAPAASVEIDQKGCRYIPHVVALQAGQELVIKNSDPFMHNVNIHSEKRQGSNLAMPVVGQQKRKFDQAEDLKFTCDVHGWMNSYVLVNANPFFAVTGADGSFEIKNLPAGSYTLEFWHETLGKKTLQVQVGDGETKTADLSFSSGA